MFTYLRISFKHLRIRDIIIICKFFIHIFYIFPSQPFICFFTDLIHFKIGPFFLSVYLFNSLAMSEQFFINFLPNPLNPKNHLNSLIVVNFLKIITLSTNFKFFNLVSLVEWSKCSTTCKLFPLWDNLAPTPTISSFLTLNRREHQKTHS